MSGRLTRAGASLLSQTHTRARTHARTPAVKHDERGVFNVAYIQQEERTGVLCGTENIGLIEVSRPRVMEAEVDDV